MARKKSKFPKFSSKNVRNAALAVTSIGVIGGATALFRGCDDKQLSLEEQQAEQIRQMHKSEMHRVDSLLNQKYKITDRASFDKLFDDALPLIQLSMFSTEVLVKEAYADASGRSVNTRGLGSYYVPKNRDPNSSEWELTSVYLKKHPEDKEISGDDALALAKGWYKTREDGRILRTMFNKLKGGELTVNEFAAIATCYYNNENRGKNFCEFVHDNYQDSVKCASWLIPEQGVEGFGGIAKRATHEACMYLNINNYVSQIGDQRVAKIEGTDIYKTSVTQLTEAECLEAGAALRKGSTKKLSEKANKINRYVCKGGKSVSQIVHENISAKRQTELLQYTDQSIDMLKQLADNRYNAALDLYNEGKYEEALAGFKAIIASGYEGADLHNDLAVTYYHLGRYEECLQECRYVLHETGETSEFAHAYYNAGRAAEALNQPQRAYDNYKLALKQDKQNKFYQKLVLKLQKDLHITNEPIEEMIKPKVKAKTENKKTAAKKPNPIPPKAKAKTPVTSKKSAPKKAASKPAKPATKATPQKKPAAKRGGSRSSR